MVGSSQSVAGPNIALNTIMAEELRQFADELEQATDFDAELQKIVSRTLKEHHRIIFSGNGYSPEWAEEAAQRGLSNLPSTADALPVYCNPKIIALVTKHGIFTEEEFRARYGIYMDAYKKVVHIEGRTMVDMVMHQILPAALSYTNNLCNDVSVKNSLNISHRAESAILQEMSKRTDRLFEGCERLKQALDKIPENREDAVSYCRTAIVPAMDSLREDADALEAMTDKSCWPYPTYSDLLFY